MAKFTALFLLTLSSFAAVCGTDTSKTVIVGGHRYDGKGFMRTVYLVSGGEITLLPDLPYGIGHSSVIFHDGKIYTCGGNTGKDVYEERCLTLEFPVKAASSWKLDLVMPVETSSRPMIIVGDDLWVLKDTKVYTVPFNGDPTTEKTLRYGLSVDEYSCGGGNENYRYFINKNSYRLYLNRDTSKPDKWVSVTYGATSTGSMGCFMEGNSVFITGGWDKYNYYRKDGQKTKLEDGDDNNLSKMVYKRAFHAMGKVDGKIAVFGGHNGTTMDSVEVYSGGKWSLSPLKLNTGDAIEMGYTTFD